MHNIISVTEFSKSKIKIEFDDGDFIVVYKGMINTESKETEDREYDILYKEMLKYGKKRAMNLLVKKDYGREELRQKLSDDGFNNNLVNDIIAYLDGFHYLDDMRIAENVIKSLKKSKSRMQIVFALKKKMFSDELITEAMDEFYKEDCEDIADENEEQNPEVTAILNFLKKSGMTGEKFDSYSYSEKQKFLAKLYRKGFNTQNINAAIAILGPD